jgi:hypothetical protein
VRSSSLLAALAFGDLCLFLDFLSLRSFSLLALGDLCLFLDFLVFSSLLALGDLSCFFDFLAFFVFFIDSLLDDLGLSFFSFFYFLTLADLILPEELGLDSLLLLGLR